MLSFLVIQLQSHPVSLLIPLSWLPRVVVRVERKLLVPPHPCILPWRGNRRGIRPGASCGPHHFPLHVSDPGPVCWKERKPHGGAGDQSHSLVHPFLQRGVNPILLNPHTCVNTHAPSWTITGTHSPSRHEHPPDRGSGRLHSPCGCSQKWLQKHSDRCPNTCRGGGHSDPDRLARPQRKAWKLPCLEPL